MNKLFKLCIEKIGAYVEKNLEKVVKCLCFSALICHFIVYFQIAQMQMQMRSMYRDGQYSPNQLRQWGLNESIHLVLYIYQSWISHTLFSLYCVLRSWFYWKLAILRFRHVYDVIVTSCVKCCTYFGMYGKKRPIAILRCQLGVSGGSVFNFTGGGNHPLGKPCYRKRLALGKTRVS